MSVVSWLVPPDDAEEPVGPDPIIVPAGDAESTSAVDHIQAALDRLPQQYRQRCDGEPGESNTQKLIRVLVSPAADLENALLAVLDSLVTPRGFMLDLRGKLVGRPRNGVTDDEIYRRYVNAQISANKSDGIVEDILTVARLVVNDDAATLTLHNEGTAAYRLSVDGVILPVEVATVLVELVVRATAAGVRPIVQWTTAATADTFTYDTGPGYDVGHYADASDHPL